MNTQPTPDQIRIMNTQPTPETDVWEAYCDECYYHMWRLRRKTERGWYDGFHIHTGEEAKGLCETLNKLERKLAETRGALDVEIKHHSETTAKWNGCHMDLTIVLCDLNQAKRERDEARKAAENSKAYKRVLKVTNAVLKRERDEAREALRDMLSGWRYIRQVHGDLYGVGWDRAQNKADAALQSLTPKP
jgi:hypothetical protein